MAIWKTRIASGVRAYFKVVRDGVLVTGIPGGNFNALLIEPGDSANVALTVTQSSQQSGVYYVDLPSAFLTTHGAGHYGLSLGIHTLVPSTVDDEIMQSVEVNQTDLDYIAGDVWDELRAGHVAVGTFGEGVNLTSAERIAVATQLLDLANGVEVGYTVRQTLRLMAAVVCGRSSGGPANPVYRNMQNDADRVASQANANGDRQNVILTP